MKVIKAKKNIQLAFLRKKTRLQLPKKSFSQQRYPDQLKITSKLKYHSLCQERKKK